MIDGIHLIASIDNQKKYIENSDLNFKSQIDIKTGEIFSTAYYREKGLQIVVYPTNKILIKANLPKILFGNNYTDLAYSELREVIKGLVDKLKINPEMLKIRSFEFGLNIPIDYSFGSIELKNNVVSFKTHPFTDMESGKRMKSIGKKYRSQEYDIKIYSKSEQLSLSYELIRFETKVRKMSYVSNGDLSNLLLISKPNNLVFLRDKLVSNIDNTLILDTTIESSKKNHKEQLLYLNWQSSIHRNNLSKYNKRKFHAEKQKLIDLMDRLGKNDIRNSLRNSIVNKWNLLMVS